MNTFAASVVKTIAYFDIFDHPLTRQELYRFLWQAERGEAFEPFLRKLDVLITENMLEERHGYLFSPGREHIVETRERRVWYVEQKMRIAQRAAKKFRWVPFCRAMFVCNQIEVGVTKESDIDVFVVVRAGRIWITRLLVTIVATLFGFRRSGAHVANHICLSFYCADDALDFDAIRIETLPDVYQAYWIDQLIPVYDPERVHADIQAQNVWQRELLPNRREHARLIDRWAVRDSRVSKAMKRFFEIAWSGAYGNMLEAQARKMQQQKMKRNVSSKLHENNTDVIVSDRMLKFHENDRRRQFQHTWNQRWQHRIFGQ